MLAALQDFFGLSRKEARGALVLIILCSLILWSPFVFRRWLLPAFTAPPTREELKLLDSLAQALESRPARTFRKEAFHAATNAGKPGRLFPFNPNHATPGQLAELGIPPFLVRRMERFRQKGGRFYRKEQLLNIYDFPPDLYRRLESYIVLQPSDRPSAPGYPQAQARQGSTSGTRGQSYPSAFDINTADTARLERLKGIGNKLAARIIKFRDALGGFHAASQYREIYGLDSAVVQELTRFARIESPVRLLNINTATIEQLVAHPYLRNKRVAGVIVSYRAQHGPYHTLDDLTRIKVLDQETLRRIAPYLAF